MNYLKRGARKTFKAIKKHKLLFIALVLLQLIFLVSAAYLTIIYEVKILENAQGIIEPLEEANYDAENIEAGNPFTKEMASIFNNYNSMMKNIKIWAVCLLFLYIFLNGGLWILTHHLLSRIKQEGTKKQGGIKLRSLPQIWLKLALSTLFLLGPLILIIYYLSIIVMRIEVFASYFTIVLKTTVYSSVVFYYFLISAFALIKIKSWKQFCKKIFFVSIKKIHRTLPVLLINLVLILAGLYLIYAAINYEQSLFLLISTGLLLVTTLVITRVFWIACLKEINNVK